MPAPLSPDTSASGARCSSIARRAAIDVARAHRLIDLAVRIGGVAQVAIDGAFGGRAPPLVVEQRHHLDERGDDRVARRRGDAAVKVDVVDQEHLPLAQRREQAGDLVGERRELIGRRALGRQTCGADLENAARLVHVVNGELVQRGEKAERVGAERRRSVRNVGARSAARSDDAEGGERAQPGAHRRAADAHLAGEVAFGRQAGAGAEAAAVDQLPDVRHHGGGAVVRDETARCPRFMIGLTNYRSRRSIGNESARQRARCCQGGRSNCNLRSAIG